MKAINLDIKKPLTSEQIKNCKAYQKRIGSLFLLLVLGFAGAVGTSIVGEIHVFAGAENHQVLVDVGYQSSAVLFLASWLTYTLQEKREIRYLNEKDDVVELLSLSVLAERHTEVAKYLEATKDRPLLTIEYEMIQEHVRNRFDNDRGCL